MIPTSDEYQIGEKIKMINCLGLNPVEGIIISKTKYSITIDYNGTPLTGSTTLCSKLYK